MWILIFREKTRVYPRSFSPFLAKNHVYKVPPLQNHHFSLKIPEIPIFQLFLHKISLYITTIAKYSDKSLELSLVVLILSKNRSGSSFFRILAQNDTFVRYPPYKRVFSLFLTKKNGVLRGFFAQKSGLTLLWILIAILLFLLLIRIEININQDAQKSSSWFLVKKAAYNTVLFLPF